ncbi:MAG: DUF4339 domain-containing protein [Anaerolineales bacterium]|jgi:hypothetical protein
MTAWYYWPDYWEPESKAKGPVSLQELVELIKTSQIKDNSYICRQGEDDWREADIVPEILAEIPIDSKGLAEAYISAASNEKWPEELWWVWEKLYRLAEHVPQTAFEVIVQITILDPPDEVLNYVGAAPLENLLALHGEAMIEKIEGEAKQNPRLRTCLAGVWRSTISDEVWERVKKAVGE